MIRWYDYVAALIAADFLIANATTALVSEVWWLQILGGVGAWIIWDTWNGPYCKWRVKQEFKK